MRDQQGAYIPINSLQSAHDQPRAGSQRAFQQAINLGQGVPCLALLEWPNCHLVTLLPSQTVYCNMLQDQELYIAHSNLT